MDDPFTGYLEKISNALGFERIGWIMTDSNNDIAMDSRAVRKVKNLLRQHIFKNIIQWNILLE